MSSAMTPGWSYRANDYKSFLKFSSRDGCLLHAFDVALQTQLANIILIHPDGTEEVVTRDEHNRAH